MANFAGFISGETLAASLGAGSVLDSEFQQTVVIGDQPVTLTLRKA